MSEHGSRDGAGQSRPAADHSGAGRLLTSAEVRDGVRLPTGQTHALRLPAWHLVLTAPKAGNFFITHPAKPGGDQGPLMPALDGFSVRVVGIDPDPTPSTEFTWTLTLDYTTRAVAAHRYATRVTYVVKKTGGTLPPDCLQTAHGRVTVGPGAPAAGAAPDSGAEVSAAGGLLKLRVTATLRGTTHDVRSAAAYHVLAKDTPDRAAILAELGRAYSEVEVPWLARISCQETQRRQFHPADDTTTNTARYTGRGEPVMNFSGDGGAGLLQITDPRPGPGALWDWRQNVRESRAVWVEKQRWITRYVASVRETIDELAQARGPNLVTRVQQERAARRLPPVASFVVPDLTDEQRAENTVRGFNGFAGHSRIVPGRGQPEFDIALEGPPGARRVAVDLSGPDTAPVATLRWERVPVDERPTKGDPNYVAHIRAVRCDGD